MTADRRTMRSPGGPDHASNQDWMRCIYYLVYNLHAKGKVQASLRNDGQPPSEPTLEALERARYAPDEFMKDRRVWNGKSVPASRTPVHSL